MLAPPLGSWCPLLGEILDPPLFRIHEFQEELLYSLSFVAFVPNGWLNVTLFVYSLLCGDISRELCKCSLNSHLFLYQPLSSCEVTSFIVISGNTSLLLVTDSWSSPIAYKCLMWRSWAFCMASPNVFGACLLLKYNVFRIDFLMGSMILPKYSSIVTVDLILLSWHPSTLLTKF